MKQPRAAEVSEKWTEIRRRRELGKRVIEKYLEHEVEGEEYERMLEDLVKELEIVFYFGESGIICDTGETC